MIINFGSINIDHVYQVSTMPVPGETISAVSYDKFLGGKGINQSIAIAKANGQVNHVGSVGSDSSWVLSEIEKLGVDTSSVSRLNCATGHAIIFVNQEGENLIVIEGGANQQLTKSE
ncbi:MAG: PfkB family carbohydrate kinase, partial [Pseudomonadota bacterium]